MAAVGGGIYRPTPGTLSPDQQRAALIPGQQQLELAQQGLQSAGTGAATARAEQDRALQTAAPWLQGTGFNSSTQQMDTSAREKLGMSGSAMSQQEYEKELGASQLNNFGTQQRVQESQLQAAAEQRRLGMFSPYFDKFANMFQQNQGGVPAGSEVQHVDFGGLNGAEDAAQAAAFARAKDKAGLIGRSATNALANTFGARGLTGSGLAVNQMGGAIGNAATQVGEVNREQAIQNANMARQRASEQYQGAITQRGQDVTQRGQNIEAARSQQGLLAGLIGAFPGQITARY